MSDFTAFVYMLMIAAGIGLLIWYFKNSAKSRKKDETGPRILTHMTADEPPKGSVLNSYVTRSASVPDRVIGNTVQSIYSYDVISERRAGNVWVGSQCETENNDANGICAICGAPR